MHPEEPTQPSQAAPSAHAFLREDERARLLADAIQSPPVSIRGSRYREIHGAFAPWMDGGQSAEWFSAHKNAMIRHEETISRLRTEWQRVRKGPAILLGVFIPAGIRRILRAAVRLASLTRECRVALAREDKARVRLDKAKGALRSAVAARETIVGPRAHAFSATFRELTCELATLRAETDFMKASLAELEREISSMRMEISAHTLGTGLGQEEPHGKEESRVERGQTVGTLNRSKWKDWRRK